MSTDGPASPDDPEWVDEIVRRAMERAASADPALPAEPSASQPDAQTAGSTSTVDEPVPGLGDADAPREAHNAPPVVSTQPEHAVDRAEGPTPIPAGAGLEVAPTDSPIPTDTPAISQATELGTDIEPERAAPNLDSREAEPARTVDEEVRSEVPVGAYAAASVAATQAPSNLTPGGSFDDSDPAFDEVVGLHAAPDTEPDTGNTKLRSFLEWGAVIVGALAVALIIKTFLMQAYFIPSGSMEPTLQVGDRVLVNKLSYTFGDISRGDLVVFNRPPSQPEGEDDLIKRVIALEGETIEIRDGEVFITTVDSTEQRRLQEPYLAEGIRTTGLVDTENCVNPTETTCGIPEGHVFVMGDNRSGSRDSRFFGPVDDDLIVGRAFLRVWPLSDFGFL